MVLSVLSEYPSTGTSKRVEPQQLRQETGKKLGYKYIFMWKTGEKVIEHNALLYEYFHLGKIKTTEKLTLLHFLCGFHQAPFALEY